MPLAEEVKFAFPRRGKKERERETKAGGRIRKKSSDEIKKRFYVPNFSNFL